MYIDSSLAKSYQNSICRKIPSNVISFTWGKSCWFFSLSVNAFSYVHSRNICAWRYIDMYVACASDSDLNATLRAYKKGMGAKEINENWTLSPRVEETKSFWFHRRMAQMKRNEMRWQWNDNTHSSRPWFFSLCLLLCTTYGVASPLLSLPGKRSSSSSSRIIYWWESVMAKLNEFSHFVIFSSKVVSLSALLYFPRVWNDSISTRQLVVVEEKGRS